MKWLSAAGWGLIAVLAGFFCAAAQQEPVQGIGTLSLIEKAAGEICNIVHQGDRKGPAQMTTEIQTKIGEALAQLTEMGVNVLQRTGSEQYTFSQEALGSALLANNGCRESVLKELRDGLVPTPYGG